MTPREGMCFSPRTYGILKGWATSFLHKERAPTSAHESRGLRQRVSFKGLEGE